MVPTEVTDPPHQVIFFPPGRRLLTVTACVPHHKFIFILCIDFLICSGQTAVPRGWLCSASQTPQRGNFAHPGELHTQGWAKVVQHLGDTASVWHLNLNVQMSPFRKSVWYYYWKQIMTFRFWADQHQSTSLPFPKKLELARRFYCRGKKRMWAEHLLDAANKHWALNITCSEGTSPGLHCVLGRGGGALPIDFY